MKYYDQVMTEEDGTGKRLYVHPDSGKKYPSITTVLSHTFSKKFETLDNKELLKALGDRAKRYGNMLHLYAEDYVLGNDLSKYGYAEKFMFKQIKPFIDQSLNKVHFTERVVIDDVTQTAGRVDCFGVWDGEDSIVDFKTSRLEKEKKDVFNYFIQTSFYARCLEIDKIVILMTVEELKDGKMWVESASKFYPFFLRLREKYRVDNGV